MSRTPPRQAQRPPTRRQFLADVALTAAGLSLARCFPDVGGRWPVECEGRFASTPLVPTASPRVVEVYDPLSVVDTPSIAIQPERAAPMLARALGELTDNTTDIWPTLLPDFAAGMRVGIKVNCLNPHCPTSVPVVRALVDSLKAGLGLGAEEILVWDRRLDELHACGITEAAVGATVLGTVNSTTDPDGPGYEDCFCTLASGKRTRLSRILTELTDLTIGAPVLKTHEVSGVTGAMKNIYGVIDNPGEFHDDLNSALPELYAIAPVRERFRLQVLDALIAVTVGGTASPRDTLARRLLVGADPVALDSYALALVNQLRDEKGLGLQPVNSAALGWLDGAETRGLGQRAYQLVPVTL